MTPLHSSEIAFAIFSHDDYQKYLSFTDWTHFFSSSKAIKDFGISLYQSKLLSWIQKSELLNHDYHSSIPIYFANAGLEKMNHHVPLSFILLLHLFLRECFIFMINRSLFEELKSPNLPNLLYSSHPSIIPSLNTISTIISDEFLGEKIEIPASLVLLEWLDQIEETTNTFIEKKEDILMNLAQNIYTLSYLFEISEKNKEIVDFLIKIFKKSSSPTVKELIQKYHEKENNRFNTEIPIDNFFLPVSTLNHPQQTFQHQASFNRPPTPTPSPKKAIKPPDLKSLYPITYVDNDSSYRTEVHLIECYNPKKS